MPFYETVNKFGTSHGPLQNKKGDNMEKALTLYINFITKCNEYLGRYVVCWLIYALIGVMVVAVIQRYIFRSPVIWGTDLSWMFYSSFTFLGGAYAMVHDYHVGVDLIYKRFPIRIQALIFVVGYIVLFFPAFYFLSEYTLQFAINSYKGGDTSPYGLWKPVVWPIKSILFISMALLLLQGIARFFEHIIVLWKGDAHVA